MPAIEPNVLLDDLVTLANSFDKLSSSPTVVEIKTTPADAPGINSADSMTSIVIFHHPGHWISCIYLKLSIA